mgnify:CR=1 FL=1
MSKSAVEQPPCHRGRLRLHRFAARRAPPRLIEKFIDAAGFATLPQSCLDYLATSKRPPIFFVAGPKASTR